MENILAAGQADIFLEFHPRYVESCLSGGIDLIRSLFDRHGYGMYTCQGLKCTSVDLNHDRIYLKSRVRP